MQVGGGKSGRFENAFKYAQASSHVKGNIVDDAKKLLMFMGIRSSRAHSEGEAEAAFMVQNKDAYAAGSQDYDAMLFGAPLVVRNLAVTGKRKLPGKGVYVEMKPEIIDLEDGLKKLEISREQLVDIAILVGTDYNEV